MAGCNSPFNEDHLKVLSTSLSTSEECKIRVSSRFVLNWLGGGAHNSDSNRLGYLDVAPEPIIVRCTVVLQFPPCQYDNGTRHQCEPDQHPCSTCGLAADMILTFRGLRRRAHGCIFTTITSWLPECILHEGLKSLIRLLRH